MTTEGKDETSGMDPGDDAALWSLLGRQEPPVKVSPYFARRVLREIALDECPRGGWFGRWREFWRGVPRHTAVWSGALACGMLCLSAVLVIPANRPPLAQSRPMEGALNVPDAVVVAPEASGEPAASTSSVAVQDEEVIADLDTLLSREESRLWTEDTDAARF